MRPSSIPPPSELRHAVVIPPPPDTIPESERKTLLPGEIDLDWAPTTEEHAS